jgi:hypothetical protein
MLNLEMARRMSKKLLKKEAKEDFCRKLNLRNTGDAIEAMIVGLRKASRRKTFRIKMNSFGDVRPGDICVGCAATCTLQAAAHKNFGASNIRNLYTRSSLLDVDSDVLWAFEYAIDDFRLGDGRRLFRFFKEKSVVFNGQTPSALGWWLSTWDWKSEIKKVVKYLELLRKHYEKTSVVK